MALNLNTSPYFDDFDATKNYNRILFKPGVAVQARELTQLQTILQNQISSLGSFTLKNGAIISGCQETTSLVSYIKITDDYFPQGSSTSSALSNSDLSKYIGERIQGVTSGITAKIVEIAEGSLAGRPALKAFYVAYDGLGEGSTTHFTAGEKLKVISNGSYRDTEFVASSLVSSPETLSDRYYGKATRIQLSAGVIYVKDQFVVTEKISTFVHPFSNSVKQRIGFEITEAVKTSVDDSTLLDPANGSYNYNAPGADRYNLSVALKSYAASAEVPETFFEYARFEYGSIIRHKVQEDPLNQLGDIIAQKFYDAHGNYVVNGMKIKLREHLNANNNGGVYTAAQGGDADKLIVEISPGIAEVAGYRRELKTPKLISFDKPTETFNVQDQTITTSYGNYVLVNEVCGVWDIEDSTTVDLYDAADGAVTAGTYSATTPSGNVIGTARVRHLVHESGTAGAAAAQFRLYLYDINMTSGEFADVRTIYYNDTNADGFADCVLESGSAVLKETDHNRLVFPLTTSYTKTLVPYDYDFQYTKEFGPSTVATADGTVGISVSGNETFPYSTGAMNDTTILANITVVAVDSFSTTSPSESITAGQVIDLTASGRSVTVDSSTQITIDLGATASGAATKVKIYANVQVADETPITKNLVTDQYVKLLVDGTDTYATSDTEFCLGVADILRVTEIRVHSSAFSTGSEGTDVTSQFRFDNGQKDNYYGLGYIRKKSNSTVDFSTTPYVLVKFDYFDVTNNGASFACVDSYASGISAGDMTLQEIPLFTRSNGIVVDLRDYIDFRPYTTNTATPTGTLGSATTNPSSVRTIVGGLTNPVPVQEFTSDITAYLAQAFRVVLGSSQGHFKLIEGTPALKVIVPPIDNVKDMTLATFKLKPYPSLSPQAAKVANRPDLSSKLTQVENPRYTMRQIGALEKRIQNLEYYTSLSILEEQARNEKFFDATGVDRFKNGLLVDPFNSFAVSAVMNPDYNCSLDLTKSEMRAYYTDDSIQWVPNKSGATDEAAQSGKIHHIPFVDVVYTQNLQASKYESIVTELLYDTVTTPPVVDPVEPVDPDPDGTYNLIRSDTAVDEGGTISIDIETNNVPAGATVGWTLTASGYTLVSGDLQSGALSGTATIGNSGVATVSWRFANETGISSNTTLTFQLASTDSDGNSTLSGANPKKTTFTLNNTNVALVCVAPYVLNAAGTACVPPACAAGYSWDAASQTCKVNPAPKEDKTYFGNVSLAPASDSWSDTEYVEPIYNNAGSHDNFEYEDAWHREWKSWTQTDTIWEEEFIGSEDVLIDSYELYVGTEEYSGYGYYEYADLYQTIDTYQQQDTYVRNRIDVGYDTYQETYTGTLPESTTTYVGEKTINTEYLSYTRAQSIDFSASGLMPNVTHKVYMGGVDKGSVTSDNQGRASGSISVSQGEFPVGVIDVMLDCSGSASWGSFSSVATAYFTSGGGEIVTKAKEYDVVTPLIPATRIVDVPNTVPMMGPSNDLRVEYGTPYEVPGDVRVDYRTVPGFVDYDGQPAFTFASFPNQANETTTTLTEIAQDQIFRSTKTQSADYLGGGNPEDFSEGVATFELTLLAYDASSADAANNYTQPTDTITPTITPAYNDILEDFDATTYDLLFDRMDLGLGAEFNLYGACGLGWDPMAQSFKVDGYDGGIYVPSVDIFFHTISNESDNNGIVLEIRNMVNGYPGPKVLGQCRKERRQCKVSTDNGDGTFTIDGGTRFTFPQPVYLESGQEYCIVPIPENDDPNYKVWIAELGKPRHGGTTIISKQAHTGVLFTSANNRTWTARQKEDLAFNINMCSFRPNVDYKVKLANAKQDWITFTNFSDSSLKFGIGDVLHNFTFSIDTAGAGYSSAPTVVITDSTGRGTGATATATIAAGAVTGITLTNPGTGFTGASNISVTLTGGGFSTAAEVSATLNLGKVLYNYDSYDYTSTIKVVLGRFYSSNTTANPAHTLVGNGTKTATVGTIHNRVVNAYAMKLPVSNHGSLGTVTPKIALTTTGATSANTTLETAYLGKTISLEEEKTILSYSNEIETYAGSAINDARPDQTPSALFEITLRTPVTNLSPMIQGEETILGIYKNEINDPVTVEEEVRTGGNATTKYISRLVKLAEGQDAEDLKVMLNNKIPSGGGVKVYYKVKHSEDDQADFVEDIFWREMEIEDRPFNTATTGWGEYTYKVSDKGSNTYGLNGSGIFEYDVTGIASISGITGGSGYTSAPTVTITHSGDGYGATATASIAAGAVTGVTVTNPGRGYEGGTITITLSGGGGVGGAASTATTQTTTYTGFKYYAIKIVHTSSNTSLIPKSTNLRAYALQA